MKTIAELAKGALAVQDACNLSGVVHSFSAVMAELWRHAELAPNRGTDWVNRHPVAVLYADKVAHLTGTQAFSEVAAIAYSICHKLAAGHNDPIYG